MTEKDCTKCGVVKSLDEFHEGRGRMGKQTHCRECISAYNRGRLEQTAPQRKAYRDARKEGARAYHRAYKLRRHYGMSVEDYDRKLAEQGGRCAICGRRPDGAGHRLAVDHDHACCPGKETCGNCVRDLLCRSCNRKLGVLEGGPWVVRAVAYLEKWGDRASV